MKSNQPRTHPLRDKIVHRNISKLAEKAAVAAQLAEQEEQQSEKTEHCAQYTAEQYSRDFIISTARVSDRVTEAAVQKFIEKPTMEHQEPTAQSEQAPTETSAFDKPLHSSTKPIDPRQNLLRRNTFERTAFPTLEQEDIPPMVLEFEPLTETRAVVFTRTEENSSPSRPAAPSNKRTVNMFALRSHTDATEQGTNAPIFPQDKQLSEIAAGVPRPETKIPEQRRHLSRRKAILKKNKAKLSHSSAHSPGMVQPLQDTQNHPIRNKKTPSGPTARQMLSPNARLLLDRTPTVPSVPNPRKNITQSAVATVFQTMKHRTRISAVRRNFHQQSLGKTGHLVYQTTLPLFSAANHAVEPLKRIFSTHIGQALARIVQKLKLLLGKALHTAAMASLPLLGGGFAVLLLSTTLGSAATVIASPMGVLFADEVQDANSISLQQIIADTNADLRQQVEDIITNHPGCEVDLQYHYPEGVSFESFWPEILAIFAVRSNYTDDEDVLIIDEFKKQKIQDVFWEMHSVNSNVETIVTSVLPEPGDPEFEYAILHGLPIEPHNVYTYILHIDVESKTLAALTEGMTGEQLEIVTLLLDTMRHMG